ncbi:MAG: hypothetical protein H7831_06845 [Magnetococcus sp. WYHC-3]
MRVTAMPYTYDVAEGNVAGHETLWEDGINTDVDNVEEDLWTFGGKYVFPSSAQKMEVVSTSTKDHATGSGVRTVRIGYLDSKFEKQSETVNLSGITAVNTVSTDIYRVNSIRVVATGTGLIADGRIDIRHLTNSPVYRTIAKGYTKGRVCIFTVPSSQTAYITEMNVSVGYPGGGRFARFTLRANYDEVFNMKRAFMIPHSEIGHEDGGLHVDFSTPLRIPATCDVVLSVIGDAVNADAICGGALRGWYEKD